MGDPSSRPGMEEMLPNESASRESVAADKPSGKGERRWRRLARDLFSTLVPALLIALLVHTFVAQATRVFGQSMEPGLHSEERLVIEKVSYWSHGPRRGDIVVLKDPDGGSDLLIKRVIGLPGERVTVADSQVYVDGTLLYEPYLDQPTNGGGRTWLVPPLSVFVLGDNRAASRDSRAFGSVSLDDVVGRAVFRYWPLNRIGIVH